MTTNKKSDSKTNAATGTTNKEVVPVKPEMKQTPVVDQNPETTATEVVPTTVEASTATEPEVKTPTKADRARVIYAEMVQDPKNGRDVIAARIKEVVGVSKSAAQTYFYQFQRETGRVVGKPETKVDKAKPLYDKLVLEGKTRKQIIEAFVNEIDLTPAGASTYYQNLKREAGKATKN